MRHRSHHSRGKHTTPKYWFSSTAMFRQPDALNTGGAQSWTLVLTPAVLVGGLVVRDLVQDTNPSSPVSQIPNTANRFTVNRIIGEICIASRGDPNQHLFLGRLSWNLGITVVDFDANGVFTPISVINAADMSEKWMWLHSTMTGPVGSDAVNYTQGLAFGADQTFQRIPVDIKTKRVVESRSCIALMLSVDTETSAAIAGGSAGFAAFKPTLRALISRQI